MREILFRGKRTDNGEWTRDDFMSWDNYGKLWWCYRQKSEEDDHE